MALRLTSKFSKCSPKYFLFFLRNATCVGGKCPREIIKKDKVERGKTQSTVKGNGSNQPDSNRGPPCPIAKNDMSKKNNKAMKLIFGNNNFNVARDTLKARFAKHVITERDYVKMMIKAHEAESERFHKLIFQLYDLGFM